MARHFLAVFWPLAEQGRIDAIVAPSGSCVAMVTHYYRLLFEDGEHEPDRHRALELSRITYELTQYLVDVLGIEETDARFPARLTYHPCCHLLRELGVDTQPRRLLAGLKDAEILPLPGGDACCGFGGVFAVKNAAISTAMGRRKARHVSSCGAEFVAVNDVSCMTHLNGIFRREGHRCRAMHIAEVLLGAGGSPEMSEGNSDGR